VFSPSILHAHNNLSFTEPMLIMLLMCEEDNTLSATITRLVSANCKRILTIYILVGIITAIIVYLQVVLATSL